MNWSRIIGNIGRTLIGAGVVVLLFVVYQLWGTAIRESRAQASLRGEFADLVEAADVPVLEDLGLDTDDLPVDLGSLNERVAAEDDRVTSTTTGPVDGDTEPDSTAPGSTATGPVDGGTGQATTARSSGGAGVIIDPVDLEFGPPPPPPDNGDAVARMVIPRIGLDKVIVHGVSTSALKSGPGHYPGTPLPGQSGNAAIAGHRTTYGAPFGDLDELERHDLIYVTTLQGSFQYSVTEKFVVSPSDVWVLDPSPNAKLTLTTCHPRFSARQRLIVVAELIGPAAPTTIGDDGEVIAGPPTLVGEDLSGDPEIDSASAPAGAASVDGDDPPAPRAGLGEIPLTRTSSDTIAEGSEVVRDVLSGAAAPRHSQVVHGGIDGISEPAWPAVFWAAVTALVWFGVWFASRHWRKWPAYGLGAPVVLVALFVFFENLSRVLPSGV